MAEFQKECDEYGCPPVLVQWQNVTDMLLAQAEPKDRKQRQKEIDKCWVALCDECGWESAEKVMTPLAPKVREMEKKAHCKLRRHVEEKDKVKWYNAGKHGSEEDTLRKKLRMWTRVALTTTALSSQKTQGGERKGEVNSSKVKEKKKENTGNAQTSPSAPPPEKPNPTSLYPTLSHPPPYEPPKQQVVMTINGGEMDVDVDDITDSMEKLHKEVSELRQIVTTEVGRTLKKANQTIQDIENTRHRQENREQPEEEASQEGSQVNDSEGTQDNIIHANPVHASTPKAQSGTHTPPGPIKVQITGDMTVDGPIANRLRSKTGPWERELVLYGPGNQLMAPQIQAPLMHRPGGNLQYQPWSHSDMTAITSKLPPITSGGSRWLSKLTALSHGTDLALGDLRCLLGQILTASQMQNLELDANTTYVANEIPFTRVSTVVSQTLRRLYPVPPTVYQNIKFRIKPGETGAAYYFRCAAEWEQMVEENSLNNPVTRDIFRTAVMTGAPNGVKQAMENNPDIPVASNEVWERHLVHHTDRAVERATKEEEELERVKTQLLKLQLEKAKGEGVTKKARQMPQHDHPRDPYEGPPYSGSPFGGPPQVQQHMTPPWGQGTNHRQGSHWRGNRGRQGGRGRRGQSGTQCYMCGENGHWARNCPRNGSQTQGQYSGPPAGGWGPRGGGSGGQGRGPQTPHNPGQHFPSPSNLQAPVHPTWGPEGGAEEC
ncbi:uncharacterized protein LOC130564356 [Triplophysa rosa]|uniref:uncharacterized protein LOC130550149 n=1 Tax=Triplophysa rosa TaxID=992332 RepID=UPI002546262E|nr:uncharacterized protein LOC130550149 [Triplophysa rosa]XP_057206341.1 uncharacterized protein LOC130564356 [Triplophysa rosa]